jgi:hypothetical protein
VSAKQVDALARSFWPVNQAAQADYETLRAHVLTTGRLPDSVTAARFTRRGLAGLIAWPTAEPVFTAEVVGARRRPWTPHADSRLDALAAGFTVLLHAADQHELLTEAMSS